MTSGDLTNVEVNARPARAAARFDVSQLVFYAFAALLCVLVILPIFWLVIYSVTDSAGHPTLDNFRRLLTDDAFRGPLVTTFIVAAISSVACCLVAAPIGW